MKAILGVCGDAHDAWERVSNPHTREGGGILIYQDFPSVWNVVGDAARSVINHWWNVVAVTTIF